MIKNPQFELAKTSKLLKYLREVEKKKIYSNFGPLYFNLKKKFENKFNYKNNQIIFTSSGHSSLLAITKYLRSKTKKNYVICPSYSFYSNPLSIVDAGFKPIFVDINEKDLILNFDLTKKILKKNKDIAFIMIVSPLGHKISINKLNDFRNKFKLPIVYDAADNFLNLEKNIIKNKIFISVSFHPTKTFGGNESGMILCPSNHTQHIKDIINFGGENYIGFNGKFSEYDAAIFLANYKHVNKRISRNKKLINEFKKSLSKKFIVLNPNNAKTNKIIIYSNVSFEKILKTLKRFNIIAKKFWSPNPMHKINIFKKYPKTSMNYTNDYSKRYFGFFIDKDLKISQIKMISQKLLSIK